MNQLQWPSRDEIARLPADGGAEFNRLIHETSPYLLQHARNPVDWRPWCDETFEEAKRRDKPVFLSVGYSTCHWCHVMARESFEDEETARLLNEHFVPVKVDREERPDVDATYMTVTQLLTGSGGWPNSVWLTPEGKPWYAGTYFPPEDRFGLPGFKTLLRRLAQAWRERRDAVQAEANRLQEAVRQAHSFVSAPERIALSRAVVCDALEALRQAHDARHGGFDGAPKFPPHGALALLLYELARRPDHALLAVLTRTLDAMAQGGIRDHLGGGFHRYSTDERWFAPHFEKMLYDNAQLARAYTDAFLLTGEQRYRRAAEETLDWVLREMADPRGGFYSALDAESEGVEGKFYLWTRGELVEVLAQERSERFAAVYGATAAGNYRGEGATPEGGANILFLPKPIEKAAASLDVPADELERQLAEDRRRLLAVRDRRARPHRDDKVLAAWNGLTIGALAHAGACLDEPRYTAAAERAAGFVLGEMMENGRLLRSWREGRAGQDAFLDDYAFLADGLSDLHEATRDDRWLDAAREILRAMEAQFADPTGGFFFSREGHDSRLARSKSGFDAAIPSGNGVTAQALLRLATLAGDADAERRAWATIAVFDGVLRQAPRAAASLVLASAVALDRRDAQALAFAGPVVATAALDKVATERGQTVEASVVLTIDEGWHVNSNEPGQENLKPTRLSMQSVAGVALDHVEYPTGADVRLAYSDEPLSVYEGTVTLRARLRMTADAHVGRRALLLHLDVQPCDDRRCLAPERLELVLPLEIR